MASTRRYCLHLRTKTGYSRSVEGERLIDPESSTACYTCLKTQHPWGPDGIPADTDGCGQDRACFEEEK